MVMLSAFLMVVQALRIFSFGIFLKPISLEFGWGRGEISGAYAIGMFTTGCFAILSGKASDKYGPRVLVTIGGALCAAGFFLLSRINAIWQVYVIWGLFMGLGGSLFFIPITSTILRWFARHRGAAVALTGAGFGFGGIISPPLAQLLISTYGWRTTYVILSIITIVTVTPLAQLLKQSPERAGIRAYGAEPDIENEEERERNPGSGDFSFTEAVKTGRFWFFGFMQFCFFSCLQVVLVHINPYALDIGIPALTAATIVSFISASSTIGRIATGFISDRVGGKPMLVICLIVSTLALIWLLFTGQIWMFYLFAAVFGLAYGGMVTLIAIVSAELFGLKSFGMIFAGLMLVSITGEAMGAPMAGVIFDVTGSYRLAFFICIALCSMAILFSLLILRYGRKQAGSS
ncbi:MAG: MFS transporter [Chloroflexota bacterium]